MLSRGAVIATILQLAVDRDWRPEWIGVPAPCAHSSCLGCIAICGYHGFRYRPLSPGLGGRRGCTARCCGRCGAIARTRTFTLLSMRAGPVGVAGSSHVIAVAACSAIRQVIQRSIAVHTNLLTFVDRRGSLHSDVVEPPALCVASGPVLRYRGRCRAILRSPLRRCGRDIVRWRSRRFLIACRLARSGHDSLIDKRRLAHGSPRRLTAISTAALGRRAANLPHQHEGRLSNK